MSPVEMNLEARFEAYVAEDKKKSSPKTGCPTPTAKR
jgi:hypothetical protein